MTRFTYCGNEFELVDQDKLTFAEAIAVEKASGFRFADLVADDAQDPGLAFTAALTWVSAKRKLPDLKFSDVCEWPLNDVEFLEDEDEAGAEPDPTQAA